MFGPDEVPRAGALQAAKQSGDFVAKVATRDAVDTFRRQVTYLSGEYGYLRPETAREAGATMNDLLARARSHSGNDVFIQRVENALRPIREAIEKYATNETGEWLFPESVCDAIPEWNPPPAGT